MADTFHKSIHFFIALLMSMILFSLFTVPASAAVLDFFTAQTETLDGSDQAAQSGRFVPIAPLPGVNETDRPPGLGPYINSLFRLAIAASAFLAVIMFAIGGIQYMTSEGFSSKDDAKDRMTSAIIGLLIVVSSVLILQIINPDILGFDLFSIS